MKFIYDDSNKEDIKISLEENDKVIGEIKFKRENDCYNIYYTYVDLDKRGLGLGKKLLEEAEKYINKLGCNIIYSCSYAKKKSEYKYKKDINKNIFRAYDIRGVVPTEIDEDTAYTIGLGFGSHIKKLGKNKCVVGKDNRISSDKLSKALIAGILKTGVDVVFLGLTTTPMYYYACMYLDIESGVMVTASHNPKDDNGFKFAFDKSGNCRGEDITNFYHELVDGNFLEGSGKVENFSITDKYVDFVKKDINFGNRKLKVVLDPANGACSSFCRKIYEQFNIDLEIINEESDGTFPNHHPDPSIEENLESLKEKVFEKNADIGISFDGDGDRLGMVTNSKKFIPADIYMILIIRDLINKVDKKVFLYDVKCSKSLSDEIDKLGGEGLCYRTGASYTKAKIKDDNIPFGGELAGHIYFNDKWPGIDCGMYVGIRILEILSNCDKSVDELLENINNYYSTPEVKIKVDDDIKFSIIDKIVEYVKEKKYNYLDIDGVRVNFDDSWALVRASNTGPNITCRFEATTEDRLEKIKDEFINKIHDYLK